MLPIDKAAEQLKEKYNQNFEFHKQMDRKRTFFDQHKAALATSPELNINQSLLQIFRMEKHSEVFFYYGYLQPDKQDLIPQLSLYLAKNFNPGFHKKYKLVFFNNCVRSNKIYSYFKNIFLCLPLQYFVALDQFIFIKPGLSHRITQWWSSDQLEKYFKNKTKYLSSASELCPLLDISLQQLIEFLPRQIIEDQFPEETKHFKEKQLADHRVNLKGQSRNVKEQKSFENFIVQINAFFQKSFQQALSIEDYQTNERKMPLILEELFYYFEEHPTAIRNEGLFRKSVSIDEENQTLEELMRNNFQYLRKIQNPHLVANLIKRFFSKLRTPVITYQIFEKLMHDQGVEDKLKLLKTSLRQLPDQNYFPLMYLLQFLCEKILPEKKYTKMNSNNLAICFAPCLLRSEKASQLDLIYATKSSHVVKLMIDSFEQIFGTKNEREEKLRSTICSERKKFQSSLNRSIRSFSDDSDSSPFLKGHEQTKFKF